MDSPHRIRASPLCVAGSVRISGYYGTQLHKLHIRVVQFDRAVRLVQVLSRGTLYETIYTPDAVASRSPLRHHHGSLRLLRTIVLSRICAAALPNRRDEAVDIDHGGP